MERVIVTGSNIPTAEEVGPNPVFSISRDLINKSGTGTTAEQLLQRAARDEWRHYSSSEQRNRWRRSVGNRCASAARFGPWRHTGAHMTTAGLRRSLVRQLLIAVLLIPTHSHHAGPEH